MGCRRNKKNTGSFTNTLASYLCECGCFKHVKLTISATQYKHKTGKHRKRAFIFKFATLKSTTPGA